MFVIKERFFAALRMTSGGVVILNPSAVTLNEVKSLRVNSVKDLSYFKIFVANAIAGVRNFSTDDSRCVSSR